MKNTNINEYIVNPSILSEDIIKKYFINKIKYYKNKFKSKYFLIKIINSLKIIFLYQTNYKHELKYVKYYKYKKTGSI